MKLKEFRKCRNISQVELSKMMYVDQATISKYENAKATPSIEMLPKLAKILNCTIEELVMAIIETKQNNSEKRAV